MNELICYTDLSREDRQAVWDMIAKLWKTPARGIAERLRERVHLDLSLQWELAYALAYIERTQKAH